MANFDKYINNKFVLVLSDENDSTTDDVLDWLSYYYVPFLRLNGTNQLYFKSLDLQNRSIVLLHNNYKIDLNNVVAYWYRRGKINLSVDYINNLKNNLLQKSCNEHLYLENVNVTNFIYRKLKKKHSIGSIEDNATNKLENLIYAKQSHLNIPNTIITTKKEDVISFLSNKTCLLTKPIGPYGLVVESETLNIGGTSIVLTKKEINSLPNKFSLSLFQHYIPKSYEVRVFYLHGKCYASAIFSQLDNKTKIDFRNYNHEKPNRTPPYLLPKAIRKNIIKFMQKINMNTGSLDFIVTPNKEYYFLEVNPVGQFFQVSYPCNFYLEKKIAEYLFKWYNKKT